jgi:RimJ/RimL family protein N-acetyltransferase
MIRTGNEIGRWVCKKLHSAPQEGAEGIGLERDGKIVAGVCYDNWNGRSIQAHIVVEGALTRYYLFAIFHYPFEYLGCDKVVCQIIQSNKESIRLCTKMGFTREATLRDVHPDGDIYLYTLERKNCRFTGERYGKVESVRARCT